MLGSELWSVVNRVYKFDLAVFCQFLASLCYDYYVQIQIQCFIVELSTIL